jgi:hypothetical protein
MHRRESSGEKLRKGKEVNRAQGKSERAERRRAKKRPDEKWRSRQGGKCSG